MTTTRTAAPCVDDDLHQRAVLLHVLGHDPALVGEDEVRRALTVDAGAAGEDAVARAVRDLCAAGVLRRTCGFVVLTRAAVRVAELLEGS